MSFNFPVTIPFPNKKSSHVQNERYNLRRPGCQVALGVLVVERETIITYSIFCTSTLPLHHYMIRFPLCMLEPGLTLCLVYCILCTTTSMSPIQTTAPNRRLPSLSCVAYFCHASHASTCNNQPLSYLRPPSRPA